MGQFMDTQRIHVGRLPDEKGIYLYELDGKVFRILAKFRGQGQAERFRKYTAVARRKDLREGFNCETEIEGFSDETRRSIMQRRKPVTGEEL